MPLEEQVELVGERAVWVTLLLKTAPRDLAHRSGRQWVKAVDDEARGTFSESGYSEIHVRNKLILRNTVT